MSEHHFAASKQTMQEVQEKTASKMEQTSQRRAKALFKKESQFAPHQMPLCARPSLLESVLLATQML